MHTLFSHALITIAGHYGAGKTNLALNIARNLLCAKAHPRIIDLDIVNPYFRTSDNRTLLDSWGVELKGPAFGGSNLDAPALDAGIDTLIAQASHESPVIIDVGGDAEGSRTLARFAPDCAAVADKLTLAVINTCRPETASVDQNLELLAHIERSGRIHFTALVGNSHLIEYTDAAVILKSLSLLWEVSAAAGLPIQCVCVPRALLPEVERGLVAHDSGEKLRLFPVERYVKTPWE
ncbi:MAG: hypothetical protein LBC35_04475 [Coriobacteriales bacterium]|jgi:hypothetical protein|nr:hypothetical protein [Coriobacteriales bacterium]